MKVSFEVSPSDLKEMALKIVRSKLGPDANINEKDLKILVRSKQNYREKEWENGEIRILFEGDI